MSRAQSWPGLPVRGTGGEQNMYCYCSVHCGLCLNGILANRIGGLSQTAEAVYSVGEAGLFFSFFSVGELEAES